VNAASAYLGTTLDNNVVNIVMSKYWYFTSVEDTKLSTNKQHSLSLLAYWRVNECDVLV
jgi:hypothetical protein